MRTGPEGVYTELVVDEPESYGGSGLGPSPCDILPAALGACTSKTVQMHARRKQWPLQAAVVRLPASAEKCPVHRTLHSEVLVQTRLREVPPG